MQKDFQIKGVMLDPARTPEKISYYKKCLEFCSDWGYNTLFWHFTDDQGCRLKFESHPK